MNKDYKYYFSSIYWSFFSKIFDAVVKFISIPLLLAYLGKEYYGLLVLVLTVNAAMQILDLGLNIGGVKFFSTWISNKEFNLINKVTRTNITFYILIGLVNSIVLIVLANNVSVFNLEDSQASIFKYLLYALAIASIPTWLNEVFKQLIIANEKISFIQKTFVIKTILNLALIIVAINYNYGLVLYFIIFVTINTVLIVPNIYKCFKDNLIKSILPGLFLSDFSKVFRYSLAIFAMGIFQLCATQSRPLILGIFSTEGVEILADYRIIEVFPLFIISLSGSIISILIPKTSKFIEEKDSKGLEKIAYNGTKNASIGVALICLPIIICAKDILNLYVGVQYEHLDIWLIIWTCTLILFIHNIPVASILLATGKTKMLVISTGIATTLSIIVNIFLCNILQVGSAVISYLVYIIFQMSFYYFYFNTKVLKLNSFKIFNSFFTIIVFAIFSILPTLLLSLDNIYFRLLFKIITWGVTFISLLFIFNKISLKDLNLQKHKYSW